MRSERPVQAKRRYHLVSRMACRLVCLMGVAALVCAGAEGPADEMEAAWIAQDGPIPTNMTHAAWRAQKLARRAERLKPVAAMSKTGANDLIFTSPPVGVGEIRVRQGKLRTSEPDLIPPAVKVLSLGGQFLNNGG